MIDTFVKNPYPGLRPFTTGESHLFFGREGQCDEVLSKLIKNKFVAVIGPSGSGKSSFVFCGLLPVLYGGVKTTSSSRWEALIMRPGARPIEALAEALLKYNENYKSFSEEDLKIQRMITATLLRSSSMGLTEFIQKTFPDTNTNYLLLVDQFEEILRYRNEIENDQTNDALSFISLLIEAVNQSKVSIYVALTMRSDFVGDCAQFSNLTQKINTSHYLIPQMIREQKKMAIVGPALVQGATIAPRLVQRLLNHLDNKHDQLPILQHALMRTWNYWEKHRETPEEPIDIKHYEAIGMMDEALSMHADEAYDELTEDQKRICAKLFKTLTEKRGKEFGVRRPTSLREIAKICQTPEEQIKIVIEKFRDPERSLLMPPYYVPLHPETIIDISHESLMRIWTRLKNWVDEESDSMQIYLRLAEGAAMYQNGKTGLWRPPDLQIALNWKNKYNPTLVWGQRFHPAFERTMLFLEYSKKEYESELRAKEFEAKRKLQVLRTTTIIFVLLFLFSLVVLVYAFAQQTKAKEEERHAKENLERALEEESKAIKAKELSDLNAKIATEEKEKANEESRKAAAAQRKADLERARAIKASKESQEASRYAMRQKQLADSSAMEAKEKEKLANDNLKLVILNENRIMADHFRNTARIMALRSKEFSDTRLQSLLAQQAFIFSQAHNGDPYDNNIYGGLYAALKKNNDPITRSLLAHKNGATRALVTAPQHNAIYSGGSDGRIFKWTYASGTWSHTPIVSDERIDSYQVYKLALSKSGRYLVAAGVNFLQAKENWIELYDLNETPPSPYKIKGFNQAVMDVIFDKQDHGFFVLDDSGHSVKYCNMKDLPKEVISSPDKINSIDICCNGEKLLGASDNGNVYTWNIRNDYASSKQKLSESPLTSIAIFPTDSTIVVGGENGEVLVVKNNVVKRNLVGHSSGIYEIKFSPDGKLLATASKDRQVRLWRIDFLQVPPIVLSNHDWVWDIAFTEDSEQIMCGINSERINVRDTEETIIVYPTDISSLSGLLCKYITKNFTREEWLQQVQEIMSEATYEATCPDLPANDK